MKIEKEIEIDIVISCKALDEITKNKLIGSSLWKTVDERDGDFYFFPKNAQFKEEMDLSIVNQWVDMLASSGIIGVTIRIAVYTSRMSATIKLSDAVMQAVARIAASIEISVYPVSDA